MGKPLHILRLFGVCNKKDGIDSVEDRLGSISTEAETSAGLLQLFRLCRFSVEWFDFCGKT